MIANKSKCILIQLWLKPASHCVPSVSGRQCRASCLLQKMVLQLAILQQGRRPWSKCLCLAAKTLHMHGNCNAVASFVLRIENCAKWFAPGVVDAATKFYGSTARKHKPPLMHASAFNVWVSIGNDLGQPGDVSWCVE